MPINLGRQAIKNEEFDALDETFRNQLSQSSGFTSFPIIGGHLLEGDALNLFLGRQLDTETDPEQISPTGAPPSLQTRVPRSGGSLLGTSASRALSRSAFSRKRQTGLSRPLLSGA